MTETKSACKYAQYAHAETLYTFLRRLVCTLGWETYEHS